jgi:tryptophanyl-tRNA synthetase
MDLQHPENKMSKSADSPLGTVFVLDDLDEVARKFKKAVTDADGEVRYDPATKPGVSNLLSILSACTGRAPDELVADYTQYGPLKADTAEAVIEVLRPVQTRYAELAADPAGTAALLDKGAAKARSLAGPTLARASEAIGLLPPG